MRFPLVAFAAAALAALVGCSSPVPVVADAAWNVNLTSSGGACQIFNSSRSLGDVNASVISTRVDDGVNGVSVTCSVTGTGPFNVTGSASQGTDLLDILVPSLPANATKTSPAVGSVSYQSDSTVSVYQSTNCDFYFADNLEGVNPGQVWVAFTCAGLTNASAGSTCPAIESYALFENCLTM